MARHLLSSGWLVPTDPPQQFVMSQWFGLWERVLQRSLRSWQNTVAFWRGGKQRNDQIIRVFVIGNRHFRIHDIANTVEKFVTTLCNQGKLLFHVLDFLLDSLHFGDFCCTVLLGLLLGRDLFFLNLIDLLSQFILFLGESSPLFILGNDFVHPCRWLETLFHEFAPFGRVPTLVISEFVDIDRHVCFLGLVGVVRCTSLAVICDASCKVGYETCSSPKRMGMIFNLV
mmetsp:Transcript_29071/g.48386  ORF Transcript_29071/g.48386 Transcript_29071/m.48386 type:complete len:228 (-) Transcript_29071:7-690(-)